MSDHAEVPQKKPVFPIILGVVFILLWVAGHIAWAALSFVGSVMANDSGAATSDQHMTLIFGMLAGQVLAGGAGIPGGLAFFIRSKRKLLVWVFAALFVIGALIQIWAFQSFFAAMGH